MLSAPDGALGDLNVTKLRDQTVDGIHAWLKRNGQSFQAALLDQFVLSREQAPNLQQTVVTQLEEVNDNGSISQMQAALLLFEMRVAPVVMVSFDFGGDNHQDSGLANELSAPKDSLATLAKSFDLVDAAGLTE